MAKSLDDAGSKTTAEAYSRYICQELSDLGEIDRDKFVANYREKKFPPNDKELTETERKQLEEAVRAFEKAMTVEWNKVSHTLFAALNFMNLPASYVDGKLKCRSLDLKRYTTPSFRRGESADGKQKIGTLVAEYLKFEEHSRRSIFLGSGSTIFEVGEAMIEKGPYSIDQLFWTVNIALVARWCELMGEGKSPPVRKISIPGGQIEPEYFRFATMKNPGWDAVGIVVVGADGGLIKTGAGKETADLYLYANSEDTGANTNTFIGLADHALLCCITADKLLENPNTGPGPKIGLPAKSTAIRILVTDEKLDDSLLKYFKGDHWHVVWELEQLKELETKSNSDKRPAPRNRNILSTATVPEPGLKANAKTTHK